MVDKWFGIWDIDLIRSPSLKIKEFLLL